MQATALVIIDVQRDFLDPNASQVGSWAKAFCVPGIRRLLAAGREREWRIIHVGTQHDGIDTLPMHQQRRGVPPYCEKGSSGGDFVITPSADEIVLYKRWYSAFDAGLDDHLDGVENVIWTGVASDCCIYQSAFDGDRRGLRNIVPFQAVSASKSEAFTASLVGLAKSAADVVEIDELLGRTTLHEAGLDPQTIEDLATEWFALQGARIASGQANDLSAVLDLLG